LREKVLHQGYLNFSKKSTLKVVKEYRNKYEAVSKVLEANTGILSLAHKDFSSVLSESEKGRGGYTSEQILRSLIVMFIEGDSYRDVVVRIENSEFFQGFVKLGVKRMMDYTFLCKAYGALREETWKKMNEALSGYAKKEEKITEEKTEVGHNGIRDKHTSSNGFMVIMGQLPHIGATNERCRGRYVEGGTETQVSPKEGKETMAVHKPQQQQEGQRHAEEDKGGLQEIN